MDHIPYKQQVIPYLDDLSDTAWAIGAVRDTIDEPQRPPVGDNTDLAGMIALIRRLGLELHGEKKGADPGHRRHLKSARAAAQQLGAAEVYRLSAAAGRMP